jgi:DNA-binding response OmpR family regulator
MEKNVLILEDDMIISDDLANIVRHALVANPRVSSSCADALGMIDDDISFALLDVKVTDGSTHDIARLLRTKRIPILFISGGDQHDMPHDLKSVAFVKKPANTMRLIDKVKSLTSDFDLQY